MLVVFLGKTKEYSEEEYGFAAKRYTGGSNLEEVISETMKMNNSGWRVLINRLGESESNHKSVNRFTDGYYNILNEISINCLKASISVKLSSLGLLHSVNLAYDNLLLLVKLASKLDKIVEVDMESKIYVDDTVSIVKEIINQNYPIRLAIQTGLKRTMQDAINLSYAKCVGFRIVTGSCYNKSGKGYETTMELDETTSDNVFHQLIEVALEHEISGGLKSAVGTFNISRLIHAMHKGLELQGLKGYEDTHGQQFIHNQLVLGNTCAALYLPFRYNKSYLKRRLDSEKDKT